MTQRHGWTEGDQQSSLETKCGIIHHKSEHYD